MFYILATTILICASIYFWISKPNTNKITYNRRKKNIELFKEEEKNINSNKGLSKESTELLLQERELNLLQDVPKTNKLGIELGKDLTFTPILLSIFSFVSILLIYFMPLSLGSFSDLKTHKIIYGFFEANKDERETKRSKLVKELDSFLKRKESTASELYLLSLKFKDIGEFSLNSRLLKQLIREYSDEIPSDIYSEYAQSLFFQEGMKFSPLVTEALNQALSKSSENPIALTLKGIQYFQEEDNILAKSTWEKAIEKTDNEEEKRAIKAAIDAIDTVKNQ
tara:strand:+ start:436 stop:1281 length:846 start_codon:yes stop_codon:yes gene_type:complete